MEVVLGLVLFGMTLAIGIPLWIRETRKTTKLYQSLHFKDIE